MATPMNNGDSNEDLSQYLDLDSPIIKGKEIKRDESQRQGRPSKLRPPTPIRSLSQEGSRRSWSPHSDGDDGEHSVSSLGSSGAGSRTRIRSRSRGRSNSGTMTISKRQSLLDRAKEKYRTQSPGAVSMSFRELQRQRSGGEDSDPGTGTGVLENSHHYGSPGGSEDVDMEAESLAGASTTYSDAQSWRHESASSFLGMISGTITKHQPPTERKSVVRVAVRVRPSLKMDVSRAMEAGEDLLTITGAPSGQRRRPKRALTTNGRRVVVVNPQAFEAAPEAVTLAAACVARRNLSSKDWASVFEFESVISPLGPRADAHPDAGVAGLPQPGDQSEVWTKVGEPLAKSIVNDGWPGFVFCYGNTFSGKTYTVFGDDPEFREAEFNDGWGLAPRICSAMMDFYKSERQKFLESEISLSEDGNLSNDEPWVMRMSFLEICGDRLRNLLETGGDSKELKIREHPSKGIFVEGLPWVEVKSLSQLTHLLSLGGTARGLSDDSRSNPKNQRPPSSRCHAILRVQLLGVANTVRQFTAVDLAGSDKEDLIETTQNANRGTTESARAYQRDIVNIKKTLSTLGLVIKGLLRREQTKAGVWRDSTLTYLMKGCGIENRQIHLVWLACLTPLTVDYAETMSTLKFSTRLQPRTVQQKEVTPFDTTDHILARKIEEDCEILLKELGSKSPSAAKSLMKQIVSDPQQRLAKLRKLSFDEVKRLKTVGIQTDPLITGLLTNNSTSENSMNAKHKEEAWRLNAKNAELQMEINALKVDRDLAVAELREVKGKFGPVEKDLLQEKDAELEEMCKKVTTLTKDRLSMQNKIIAMQADIDSHQAEVQKLQLSLNQSKTDIENGKRQEASNQRDEALHYLNEQVQTLKLCLEKALEQRDVANRSLEAAEGVLQSIKENGDKEQGQARTIYQLEAKISHQEELMQKLKEENDRLSISYVDAKEELMKHPKKEIELQAQLEGMVQERNRALEAIKNKDDTIQLHKAQADSALRMLSQRQQALSRLFQQSASVPNGPNPLIEQDAMKAKLSSQTEAIEVELAQLKSLSESLGKVLASCASGNALQELQDERKRHAETRNKLARLSGQLGFPIPDQDPVLGGLTDANGEGAMEVRYLREQLNIEREARRQESTKHDSLLRHQEETAQRELETALDEVLEGVRQQTTGVRHQVGQLQKDKQVLRAEVESTRRQLQQSRNEAQQLRDEFDAKAQAHDRELSALWLTIHKLEILDAAKDTAMQELQSEKEEALSRVKVKDELIFTLSKEKEEISKELEEVDAQLIAAAESEGLSIEDVLSGPKSSTGAGFQSANSSISMPSSLKTRQRSQSFGSVAVGGVVTFPKQGGWSKVVERQIEELNEFVQEDGSSNRRSHSKKPVRRRSKSRPKSR